MTMPHITEIAHKSELEAELKENIFQCQEYAKWKVDFFAELSVGNWKEFAREVRQFRIKWGLYETF